MKRRRLAIIVSAAVVILALLILAVATWGRHRGLMIKTVDELRAQTGSRITLVGKFSLFGKPGPSILYLNKPIYILPQGERVWGPPWTGLEGRRVCVTGILRFWHNELPPIAVKGTPSPDYYYFVWEESDVRPAQ